MFRKYQLIVPDYINNSLGRQFMPVHSYISECQDLPVIIGRTSCSTKHGWLTVLALVGKKSDIRKVVNAAYRGCQDSQDKKEIKKLLSAIRLETLLDHGKVKLNKKVFEWFSPFHTFLQKSRSQNQRVVFDGADIYQAEDALFETIQEGSRPTGMVRQANQANLTAPLIVEFLNGIKCPQEE